MRNKRERTDELLLRGGDCNPVLVSYVALVDGIDVSLEVALSSHAGAVTVRYRRHSCCSAASQIGAVGVWAAVD